MKRSQNPDWYKLTKLLKKEGLINTGLTIPYIFGAYELLGNPFEDIIDLLEEILKNRIDKYPVIQKCTAIHQHVVAVEERNQYHKSYLKDVKLLNAKNEIGLIISSNTNLGQTSELIYKNLNRLYKKPIDDKTYSWHHKKQEWRPFNKEEVRLIMSIK
ncbi:hypothetical protein [Muricauda brasiliensis]|uniref:hypothetical protein n=1 Tax=Muricauda brasiliensis TaxID=2162892 RepID=UPI00131EE2E2|nr:hypothetical protein [Muricauda brasiliensis]